jgi:hypothetical protein
VTKGRDLPQGSVDLIVRAMEDQEMWQQERCQPWHRAAVAWAEARRTPVLAIDPPLALPASSTWPTSASPRMSSRVRGGGPKPAARLVGREDRGHYLPQVCAVCSVQCAVCSGRLVTKQVTYFNVFLV